MDNKKEEKEFIYIKEFVKGETVIHKIRINKSKKKVKFKIIHI